MPGPGAEHVEEVELVEYVANERGAGGGEAYHSDEDDDMAGHMHGGHPVRCANQ